MKEYRVMIECANTRTLGVTIYAKDRDDAIKFVKRNHRMRFWTGEYKRVKSAKAVPVPRAQKPTWEPSDALVERLSNELWHAWPADETQ